MKKKMLSLVMALGMVVGTATVASAASNDGTAGTDFTGTGAVTEAIIDVEIPTALDFKIDPFNIANGGKISTAALTIENKSNVPVEIQMTKLKATPAGDANVVESLAADSDTKDVFLWVGAVTPTFDKVSGDITSVKATAAYTEAKNKNQVATTTESTETVSFGSLLQATYNENGSYEATNAKGKLYLGVLGDANTVADWAEEDAVEITATFNVVPKVVGSVK